MRYNYVMPTQAITFKKWGRKGFSLFRVLNKLVHIGFLAVAYHQSAARPVAEFVSDTTSVIREYDLEEIEVTAQRAPVTFSETARIIAVISRSELTQLPAQTLPELLDYLPGVDVRQRGSEGVQADLTIRGGTFDQTLILLNGINITDPQTGHHNLNLPVSFDQIERIELLEGPASRVYGPNAFSGAVNIVTTQPEEETISGHFSYGEHNLTSTNISGTLRTGRFTHLLALDNRSSDGYINNTDFSAGNVFYNTWAELPDGKLNVQFGFADKGFGANSFYTPKYPEQYEKTQTWFSSLKWNSNSKLHLTPGIYWRRHSDRFELFRNEAPEWYKSHNYHQTDVLGLQLNSWFLSPLGKTAVGTEARSENIRSNVLGEKMENPQKIPGENSYFTHAKSRTSFSVFLEHSVYLNKFAVSAGVLLHHFSDPGFSWNLYPGAEISYQISTPVKLYAAAGQSLRMPTFTDLYYSGPTNQGNPDLKPEEIQNLEGGFKFQTKFVRGNISLFTQKGKNLIDWIKPAESDKWQTQNLTSVTSSGIEIGSQFYPQVIWGDNFFISQVSASYFYNHLKKQEEAEIISYYVLDNLKHKFSFTLQHKITKRLTASWNLTAQDRNGNYTLYNINTGTGTETEYEPFWLLDGKLNYHVGIADWYVSATNLFDTGYFDLGNVPQPGRWFRTGIRINLGIDKLRKP